MVDELVHAPVFAKLPAASIERIAPLFERRTLAPGATLYWEEHLADSLGILTQGSLRVKIGVQEVGTIREGELVGETSAFLGEPRTATVEATSDAVVWVLPADRFDELADTHPAVFDRLLDRALQEMTRRVRAADLHIAKIASGTDDLPAPRPASRFLQAFRKLGAVAAEPKIPVLPALRRLPGLADAPATVLGTLAQAMTFRRVDADVAVCLEGDEGSSAFVLTEGDVKVLRNVRGGRARRLATLGPGSVFGTGSLILGERRNASVVTMSAAGIYEMPATAMESLPAPVGRLWRMSLLHALRAQVNGASNHLALLRGGTSWTDRERLREASARIVAFRADVDDPWTIDGRIR